MKTEVMLLEIIGRGIYRELRTSRNWLMRQRTTKICRELKGLTINLSSGLKNMFRTINTIRNQSMKSWRKLRMQFAINSETRIIVATQSAGLFINSMRVGDFWKARSCLGSVKLLATKT